MEKNIELNKQQIESLKKETKNIKEMLAILKFSTKDGKINDGLKENIPNLMEKYMNNVKKIISWTGEPSTQEKEITISMEKYYQEQIDNLKEAVTKQNSIITLPALVKEVFQKIDMWWDIEGFNYISQKKIDQTGAVEVELGVLLDNMSMLLTAKINAEKKEERTKIQYMKDKGYVLDEKNKTHGVFLIDNERNRTLLRKEIKKAFPSARINSITNQYWENENGEEILIIKNIVVRIKNISDVERLEVDEKEFAIE